MDFRSPEHKILSSLTEKLIRTASKMVNIGEIEDQLRKNPHPVFLPVMNACLGEIQKIQHPRTRDLLHNMILLGFWKVGFSNSFRQPAISILERLSSVLPGLPFDRYRQDPVDWKVNKYERHLKDQSNFWKLEALRKDDHGKA